MVDKQVGVRAPGGDAESTEKRGLLWLLDEEAIYPGATDQSFVERLLLQVLTNYIQLWRIKYWVVLIFFIFFQNPLSSYLLNAYFYFSNRIVVADLLLPIVEGHHLPREILVYRIKVIS